MRPRHFAEGEAEPSRLMSKKAIPRNAALSPLRKRKMRNQGRLQLPGGGNDKPQRENARGERAFSVVDLG
jgi:hypothetical protein